MKLVAAGPLDPERAREIVRDLEIVQVASAADLAGSCQDADIVLARADDVLAISESLLLFDDGTPYVEVETADQVFERRDIEVGLSDGIQIEVVSGLTEEDRAKNPGSGSQRG